MNPTINAHRLVNPRGIQVKSFSPPFSSFGWVEKNYSDSLAIRRLFSLGRAESARTLLIENINAAGMIAEENAEISNYVNGHTMEDLVRLSFWKTDFKRPNNADCTDDNCIGYAILKHDKVTSTGYDAWHVFEAVFRKYDHRHNYVPDPMEFKVTLGGVPITMWGVLYAQQNELNKACAQVALRSLVSKVKRRDVSYTEINNFASQAATIPFSPKDGLTTVQIRAVLEGFGIRYLDFDYSQHHSRERTRNPYQKYVYAGVESGAGALLGFSLKGPAITGESRHIIPFYGHTFNQDTWAPEADMAYFRVGEKLRYVSSINWTSSFLGHDDNFGPNFCVPRIYISPKQVRYVVELLKPGVVYGGVEAEAMSLRFLYSVLNYGTNSNVWWKRLAFYTRPDIQRVILRAVSVDREKYVQHLAMEKDWNGNSERRELIDFFSSWLPNDLWVVEISIPQLFPANERKLGEIVLNAKVETGERRGNISHFVLARLPSLFYFSRGRKDFLTIPSAFTSHIQVIHV